MDAACWAAHVLPCHRAPQEGSGNGGLPPGSAKEPCRSHLCLKSKASGSHSPLLGNPSASPSCHATVTHLSTPPGWDMRPWGGDRGCSPLNNLPCLWLDLKRPWAGGIRPHTEQTVPAVAAMKAVHTAWTPSGSTSLSLPDPPCNHSCRQGDSHPPCAGDWVVITCLC